MAKISNVIAYGTHADRPAAGSTGALYFESDTGDGFRDNGMGWDLIVSASGRPVPLTVVHATTDVTVAAAHTLVMVEAAAITVTLPDPTLCAGLEVVTTEAWSDSWHYNVHDYGGAVLYTGAYGAYRFVSDGTAWTTAD